MKDIIFFPKDEAAEFLVPPPKPARNYTPEWYKKIPAFVDNKQEIEPFVDGKRAKFNTTAKMCVPFSDTFNFGYIQETWCDIFVNRNEDGTADVYFSSLPDLIEARDTLNVGESPDFYKNEFAWKIQWVPQLPKGYSVLYTHPLNHHDLPFYSLSGIVDADKFIYERDGNHPVLIRSSFEGFIPKGTPMFQIIPFKRDDWQSHIQESDPYHMIRSEVTRQKFWGGYKKFFWSKKTFK